MHDGLLIMEGEKRLRGKVLRNEPLSRHTSMGIGGTADFYCRPEDEGDVRSFLSFAREEDIPLKVIGNGTNILFRDGGFRGMVMETPFRNKTIRDRFVTAGAAVPLATLIAATVQKGLGGLESLSGIPGTVGGAVMTNAGTFAGETSQSFVSLRALDMEGNLVEFKRADIQFAYRENTLPQSLLIEEVSFQLIPKGRPECEAIVRDLLRRRKETQPTQVKNVGCIFKNPAGDHAGRLIDQLGLKGTWSGKAEISRVHGNFIVNHRGATSRDVLELIQLIQERVLEERGISLELEIEIVGED